MFVLTNKGKLELYSRYDAPKFCLDESLTEVSTEKPGLTKKSLGDPSVEYPDGHPVHVSSLMCMVGSPGCICINGTGYYW